ncbi:MAG: metal ABC transporter permease [Thermoguttaceae bacterium]
MTAFLRDMATNPFLASGLAAALLGSLACGLIGPYVVTRRIVFLSGAIAHMAVGGIGGAVFLAARFPHSLSQLHPIHGAMAAALAGAVLIGYVHQRASERTDTLIGALWAIGMALGILLIKFTPGYQTELMSYLFGNIALVGWDDVWLIAGLDAVILAAVLLLHKRLLAICLDQQQAELQGINVLGTNIALLCLVALTVICLTRVVGLILVIALLSLPAATAAHHVRRMSPLLLVSTLLCAGLTTLPRIAVYGTRIDPQSAIVLSAAAVYLLSLLGRRLVGRFR